jgi:hypothetical protein
MKKILALSLALLMFVTPAKASWNRIPKKVRLKIETIAIVLGIQMAKETVESGIRVKEKIIDYFTKPAEKKEKLWAKLQSQIVEIDKQVKIQNQAADKLDEHGHSDDLEANEEYEYKYNIETIKYWERRKKAAKTAILYNELVGDKDNLEREKGYVAEAKRNITLLSAKLNDES